MSSVASSAAVGPPPGMRVRLSSNESPFGPSPHAVAAATDAAARAHLYPDDQSVELRGELAAVEGVRHDEVAVGNGSAGLLMDIVGHECRREVADDPAVVSFERGFVVYRLGARNAGARYVEAPTGGPATPARDGYDRDVDALLDLVDETTRVVVVDNPGNPTGAHLGAGQLTRLIEGVPEHVTVVVDEAYHPFASGQGDYATVAELEVGHPRLLTVRTFSKAHALAGLRVGYVLGPAGLIAELDAWRVRFNLTSAAQAAAVASLHDTDHLEACVEGTLEGRRRMAEGLRELAVPFTDGLGNFLTIELGTAAAPVVEAFADRGIGVRPLAPYGMDEQIRVTVGTPDEVGAFLDAARDVLPANADPS
jgi:histidinol-phosphate aminotransferase